MLPSLLARDVQKGLKNFLIAGFEPSDPLFAGIMKRFTERESRWMKGPYIQLGLPFRTGTKGKNFFATFETEFPGHVHQEAAWERLASDRLAASTLVATGTGSGTVLASESDAPGPEAARGRVLPYVCGTQNRRRCWKSGMAGPAAVLPE